LHFGAFANDQYLWSSFHEWLRSSGLQLWIDVRFVFLCQMLMNALTCGFRLTILAIAYGDVMRRWIDIGFSTGVNN
jgi:hypothetical protein